jgi:hypothetical protein
LAHFCRAHWAESQREEEEDDLLFAKVRADIDHVAWFAGQLKGWGDGSDGKGHWWLAPSVSAPIDVESVLMMGIREIV